MRPLSLLQIFTYDTYISLALYYHFNFSISLLLYMQLYIDYESLCKFKFLQIQIKNFKLNERMFHYLNVIVPTSFLIFYMYTFALVHIRKQYNRLKLIKILC